jgi:hypothetical protein
MAGRFLIAASAPALPAWAIRVSNCSCVISIFFTSSIDLISASPVTAGSAPASASGSGSVLIVSTLHDLSGITCVRGSAGVGVNDASNPSGQDVIWKALPFASRSTR